MLLGKKTKEKVEYSLLSNIRYIYAILFKNRPVMPLCVVLTIILSVILPIISNLIIPLAVDSITKHNGALVFVTKMALLMTVYGILNFIQNYIAKWNRLYIDQAQNKDFLINLLMKSMTTDYENIESEKQQRIVNKASHAVNMYRQGVDSMYYSIPGLISHTLGIIIYATTITMIDFRILVIILISSLLGLLFEKRARTIEQSYKEEQFCIWGRLYYLKMLGMKMDNAKDIRIYNMKDWIFNAVMKLNARNIKVDINKQKGWLWVATVDVIMALLRDLVSYGILVHEVISGRLELAGFLFCLNIVSGISNWIRYLRGSWSDILNGNIMLNDYRFMMDYPDRFLRNEGRSIADISNRPPKIEFCNVSYKYEGAQDSALKNINLTINPGENIALVGHNGAGKTTLVKLLCGLYHPTEGKILIDGYPIDEYNLEEYHTLLSTIFQDPYVLPFSIAANIACVDEEQIDYDKVRSCLIKSGLYQDVEKLKDKEKTYISQTFNNEGIELSGGMQQKLMLARAMYKDAAVMILDEPTAALDPIAESHMYEEYDKISYNKSSLFISHRLASTKFCDRIIYLENGEIVETGTHNELMELKGRYAEIFQVQSQYYKNEEEDTNENALYSGC